MQEPYLQGGQQQGNLVLCSKGGFLYEWVLASQTYFISWLGRVRAR